MKVHFILHFNICAHYYYYYYYYYYYICLTAFFQDNLGNPAPER